MTQIIILSETARTTVKCKNMSKLIHKQRIFVLYICAISIFLHFSTPKTQKVQLWLVSTVYVFTLATTGRVCWHKHGMWYFTLYGHNDNFRKRKEKKKKNYASSSFRPSLVIFQVCNFICFKVFLFFHHCWDNPHFTQIYSC